MAKEELQERRATPRRRLRDRIASLERSPSPRLRGRHRLANLVLLVEDDLRETALALGRVEHFLGAAAALLEKPDLRPEDLSRLATDPEVIERIDHLADSLGNLRSRMSRIAASLE